MFWLRNKKIIFWDAPLIKGLAYCTSLFPAISILTLSGTLSLTVTHSFLTLISIDTHFQHILLQNNENNSEGSVIF